VSSQQKHAGWIAPRGGQRVMEIHAEQKTTRQRDIREVSFISLEPPTEAAAPEELWLGPDTLAWAHSGTPRLTRRSDYVKGACLPQCHVTTTLGASLPAARGCL
jgi:hypothetical protein